MDFQVGLVLLGYYATMYGLLMGLAWIGLKIYEKVYR